MDMGNLWYSTGHAVAQLVVAAVGPGGKYLSPMAMPKGTGQVVYSTDL